MPSVIHESRQKSPCIMGFFVSNDEVKHLPRGWRRGINGFIIQFRCGFI